MYRIIHRDFHDKEYGRESYLKNWPMLYILENGKQVYVGQSTEVTRRMLEHKRKEDKKHFKDAHFIYSREFNQSVTFDFEFRLIQLLAADERFQMTNGNSGLANLDYYNREYYDGRFPELWDKLWKRKIVTHTIEELVNSDLFKYSPYKALNESQRVAVDEIWDSILCSRKQPILVNGMPGSGKTIVAVFLFKKIRDSEELRDKKIGLVIPQTSLRKTMKELFRHIYGLKASDVLGPSDVTKKRYDILLVDEAHRLHRRKNIPNMGAHDTNNRRLGLAQDATELDWVLKQCDCPILFYDKFQVVGPSGIRMKELQDKIKSDYSGRMVTYYTLYTQMRVLGGNDYIEYVADLLHNHPQARQQFSGYEFKIVERFEVFQQLLNQKEHESGLSRMVAGYAWPWISKRDQSQKDICIEGISRMWNNRTENWVHCDTAIDEVGCIHSIQGYDLNYAFVIMGNEIRFDDVNQKIVIDRDSYFDRNGKATASDEELLEYITNIYYVLMTRGIKGTYLYICDDKLRRHFKNFIDTI